METKDVIYELRNKAGLSQDELAEKLFVTRQAVSRWETGETIPNVETLKLLSMLFDVSINSLLCFPCMDDLVDRTKEEENEEAFDFELAQKYIEEMRPKWDCLRTYENLGGSSMMDSFKGQLIKEFNELNVEGMPKVESLNSLVGSYVNLEYRLPNGDVMKFLDDNATYLGNQLECKFGGDRCFGLVGNMEFLLVCTYGVDGENPELVIYKKR